MLVCSSMETMMEQRKRNFNASSVPFLVNDDDNSNDHKRPRRSSSIVSNNNNDCTILDNEKVPENHNYNDYETEEHKNNHNHISSSDTSCCSSTVVASCSSAEMTSACSSSLVEAPKNNQNNCKDARTDQRNYLTHKTVIESSNILTTGTDKVHHDKSGESTSTNHQNAPIQKHTTTTTYDDDGGGDDDVLVDELTSKLDCWSLTNLKEWRKQQIIESSCTLTPPPPAVLPLTVENHTNYDLKTHHNKDAFTRAIMANPHPNTSSSITSRVAAVSSSSSSSRSAMRQRQNEARKEMIRLMTHASSQKQE